MSWVLDLDGVVWRGNEAISGSSEAIARLTKLGESVYFVTNNSILTPSQYVDKMKSFGIGVRNDQIFTSAQAAALLLDPLAKVFVIGGGVGVRQAVEERGITLVDDASKADAVILGWDPAISFEKITSAMRAVRAGAQFIATNADPTYPNPDGLLPGTGSLAAVVAVASGVEPVFAGKPNPAIVSLISPYLTGEDIMVGDRLSTDGEFARVLGAHFGLVLSGVYEPFGNEDFAKTATIAPNLLAMVELFEKNLSLPCGDFSN